MNERQLMEKITRDLVDQGLLIEAGWVGLRMMSVPKDAPQIQVDEMRDSFFAGAQHLFGSIMSMMDPDAEPTACRHAADGSLIARSWTSSSRTTPPSTP